MANAKKVYRYNPKTHTLSIKKSGSNEFVQINGEFYVDAANDLFYRINESAPFKTEYDLPDLVECTGKWSLNKENRLEFYLKKTGEIVSPEKITFRSSVIRTGVGNIVCALNVTNDLVRIIVFRGTFSVDASNNLAFKFRDSMAANTFTFTGEWVNSRNNRLQYVYKRKKMLTKKVEQRTIAFSGKWDLSDNKSIKYILSSDNDFRFKAQLQSPDLRKETDKIKYLIGTSKSRKSIEVYGQWKFGRDAELSFELSGDDNRANKLSLSLVKLIKTKMLFTLDVALKRGAKPSYSLRCDQKFLQNSASLWAKVKKQSRDLSSSAGLTIKF